MPLPAHRSLPPLGQAPVQGCLHLPTLVGFRHVRVLQCLKVFHTASFAHNVLICGKGNWLQCQHRGLHRCLDVRASWELARASEHDVLHDN